MPQHTPGPWRIATGPTRAGQFLAVVEAHGSAPISIIADADVQPHEVSANARAMAAAAEMLEELRRCAAELAACGEVLKTDDGCAQARAWAARTRALIARTAGRRAGAPDIWAARTRALIARIETEAT